MGETLYNHALMKIAVLSDIHGNRPALETVTDHIEAWRADVVVVNGDVVNRGPLSKPCWDFVQQKMDDAGWLMTKGNHEEFVSEWAKPRDISPMEFEIFRSSYWAYEQFEGRVEALEALPLHLSLPTDAGGELRFAHGSMVGNRDGIYVHMMDGEIREKIQPAPAVFFAGHTHRPLVRMVDGTLVVNTGSAGTAFDGDIRASYAQLVWREGAWQAEIVRLAYDREQMKRDFELTGYLAESGPLTRIFYLEWERSMNLVNHWGRAWQKAVIAGEIGLVESIERFLADWLGAV